MSTFPNFRFLVSKKQSHDRIHACVFLDKLHLRLLLGYLNSAGVVSIVLIKFFTYYKRRSLMQVLLIYRVVQRLVLSYLFPACRTQVRFWYSLLIHSSRCHALGLVIHPGYFKSHQYHSATELSTSLNPPSPLPLLYFKE